MRLFGHELSTSWVLLIIVVAYWVFSGIGAWWLRRRQSAERRRADERPRHPREAEAQKAILRPSTPRSKEEREDRRLDNIQARARAWKRWNETPRDASDDKRIVTAASLWGAPQKSAPFPKRFHASQLGKATLGQDLYDEMLGTPMDVDDPVQILSPRTWADLCLDVWALHSRSGQRPRLMRVWLNEQRALVEIHRGKTVTVDDILPDEVVGFVRGFTRLGPRKGDVDGLRWLSRGSVPIVRGRCGGHINSSRSSALSLPTGRLSAMLCARQTFTSWRSPACATTRRGLRTSRSCASSMPVG